MKLSPQTCHLAPVARVKRSRKVTALASLTQSQEKKLAFASSSTILPQATTSESSPSPHEPTTSYYSISHMLSPPRKFIFCSCFYELINPPSARELQNNLSISCVVSMLHLCYIYALYLLPLCHLFVVTKLFYLITPCEVSLS